MSHTYTMPDAQDYNKINWIENRIELFIKQIKMKTLRILDTN